MSAQRHHRYADKKYNRRQLRTKRAAAKKLGLFLCQFLYYLKRQQQLTEMGYLQSFKPTLTYEIIRL